MIVVCLYEMLSTMFPNYGELTMKRIPAALAALCLLAASSGMFNPQAARAGDSRFDVNDISFLWPAPTDAADVQKLIAITETGADGAALWPASLFEKVLSTAKSSKVSDLGRTDRVITLPPGLDQPANWKIVGIRIDPAAPGTSPGIQRSSPVGVQPQIRLVVQPVTVSGTNVEIHDFTAHLVFGFDNLTEPAAKSASFAPLVEDLKTLKNGLLTKGIETNGPLGVHPGFRSLDLAVGLRALLKKHLNQARLGAVAFMGLVDSAEPWIFFAMGKRPNGEFVASPPQMLSKRNSAPVLPLPKNPTFGAEGLSTSMLFGPAVNLDALLFPNTANPTLKSLQFRDIPDCIADPDVCFFFNTDCISCHTESTRRAQFSLQAGSGRLHYARPAGISGPNPALLPTDDWNVRNFGWVPFTNPVETVTMRTANEAAASADFINRVYLGLAPASGPAAPVLTVRGRKVTAVSNALTLVMKIKSPADAQQLRTFLQESQSQPADKNPIAVALTSLGLVHDARFVFFGDEQLAVITTYDGEFDTYIHAFVDAIGPVFDELLKHVTDAPPLPVRDNATAFLQYVKKRDLKAFGGLYSAYPTLTVQDIQLFQEKAAHSAPAPSLTTGGSP